MYYQTLEILCNIITLGTRRSNRESSGTPGIEVQLAQPVESKASIALVDEPYAEAQRAL